MKLANLKRIFDEEDWIESYYCIYKIKNIVNGKSYIGQAAYFPDRFLYEGWSHRNLMTSADNVIYKAIRKYGPENFQVMILDENLSKDQMNPREVYWIARLHTYISDKLGPGYNMTKGGDNRGMTPYIGRKRLLELYPDTNGASPNWIAGGRKWNLDHYPETNGANPKWSEAGRSKLKEIYPDTNGMPTECLSAAHTPESLKKSLETHKANHNGMMAFNTPEHYERMKELRGGDYMTACHTSSSRLKRMITLLINNINKRLDFLERNNYELTASNYRDNNFDASMCWNRHIPAVLEYMTELRSDQRWTEVMEFIFSRYSINPDHSVRGRDRILIRPN